MRVASRKDDALTNLLAGGVLDSGLHEVPQDGAVGVFVEYLFVDFLSFVVEERRILAIFLKLVALLL